MPTQHIGSWLVEGHRSKSRVPVYWGDGASTWQDRRRVARFRGPIRPGGLSPIAKLAVSAMRYQHARLEYADGRTASTVHSHVDLAEASSHGKDIWRQPPDGRPTRSYPATPLRLGCHRGFASLPASDVICPWALSAAARLRSSAGRRPGSTVGLPGPRRVQEPPCACRRAQYQHSAAR